ncbi:branched-chain amino acid transport system II carrier protein [Alloscardovia omnicolens]|uniref:branched-chain amino acid transport system II carrier protein n=1 Tax=Alloscardovia omnicolens TaxID=419015 RepID=UPI0028E959E5|nr:branched-chain amino acid transport system II carrier protein [Alloscardovia omnicolens]
MKKKLTGKESIIVASMLFGLFFGAGNLIFPVSMGQKAGSHVWPAIIGFCITGVGLPLLGIVALSVSQRKSLFDMTSLVGKGFAYFFTLALYLTIGPFFAIPRTATVSFQVGVAPLLKPELRSIALFIFSVLFFVVVLFFSLKPSRILDWVGKILNPLFLVVLSVLVITALIHPMGNIGAVAAHEDYVHQAFFTGFLEGYNTMDALASVAFGVILVDVIRGLGVKESRDAAVASVKSGVMAGFFMVLIYGLLTIIGAQSGAVLGVSEDGGSALFAIAQHYFGTAGGVLLGTVITLACLKTAIGLITSISTTFTEIFPRLANYNLFAIIFTLISFVIANAGLNAIITLSVPVLMFLYPLTVMLMILCVLGSSFAFHKSVFVSAMTLTTISAAITFVSTLTKILVGSVPWLAPVHHAAATIDSALPLSGIGMSWIVPAVIGIIVGYIYYFARVAHTK